MIIFVGKAGYLASPPEIFAEGRKEEGREGEMGWGKKEQSREGRKRGRREEGKRQVSHSVFPHPVCL